MVYPNPSGGEFTLSTKKDITVMIYDIQGRIVYTENLLQGNHVINMSAANAGQYLLKAASGDKAQNVVLIKE